MTSLEALILGAIQGFTEFLPVSSSGHLVLAQHFLHITDSTLAFDIFIHFTTLLAVIIYFRKTIAEITKKELQLLAVGTVPAIFVGIFLKDLIEGAFNSIAYVSAEMIITGVICLLINRKLQERSSDTKVTLLHDISFKQALIIGLGQAIAISPGISRSGTTVLVALKQNIAREQAFHFSFLLVIPAILGASILELYSIFNNPGSASGISPSSYIIGGIAAFIVGLGSLKLFEYVMKEAKIQYFGVYCIILGIVSFLITLS